MTIVYPYFRYLIDRENHKSLVYYFTGPTDVALIFDEPSECDWGDMGNSGKAQAKEPEVVKNDVPPSEHNTRGEGLGKLYVPHFENLKQNACCAPCLKIMYAVLGLITAFQAIGLIGVAITTAIATKIYSSDVSGRLAAMMVLAVSAAVVLSIIIYAVVGIFRNHKKPAHSASVVLVVIAVIQAIILGVSVKVTVEDEVNLSRSLSESFRLARDDNPRHVKIWARTQHDLNCCGIYTPEDYRIPNMPYYFPPNVPISCCPSYDPDRSELVQEREREACKARKDFYDIGCRNLVIDVFRETAVMVMSVSILLIILEVLLAILGAIISKKCDTKTPSPEEEPSEVVVNNKKSNT